MLLRHILASVFQAVIRVNYVKNNPLRERLFAKLCDDMEAEHRTLMYYCEIHRLSHAKVLHRKFELEEETAIFLSDGNNNDDANLCSNKDFIQKVAYLVDILEKISNSNKSLHDLQINTLTQNDKVNAFMNKNCGKET
jgi:hypothetical protein